MSQASKSGSNALKKQATPRNRLTKSWETMPKVSSLGIKWKGGFKGSYIPVSELIDRKIVVNITNFEIRPSCMHGSQMCMTQIEICGRPMVTWHGSQNLINFLNECRMQEQQGAQCFPIEDCIFTQGDDGGYYLADADNTCTRLSAEEINNIAKYRRRGGSQVRNNRFNN